MVFLHHVGGLGPNRRLPAQIFAGMLDAYKTSTRTLIVASVLFPFSLGTAFSVAMIAFAGAAILYDTSNVLREYPEDRLRCGFPSA